MLYKEIGSKFDLHILGRRVFQFNYGSAGGVPSEALAEIGLRLRLDRYLALNSDCRTDREIAEDVFSFDFVEGAGVLRFGSFRTGKEQRRRAEAHEQPRRRAKTEARNRRKR